MVMKTPGDTKQVKEPLLPSQHDVLEVAAFIMAFFAPPLGFIMGCVSFNTARRDGRHPSGLAITAMVIGPVVALAVLIAAITLAMHARQAVPVPCDFSNPDFPNC